MLDGWYAIMICWGDPHEEDSPDILQFKNGKWVPMWKGVLRLPNFQYFQGPFQSHVEADVWAHANDPVGRFLAERTGATS